MRVLAPAQPHEYSDTHDGRELILGIDLGGTSIKLGLIQDHVILARSEVATSEFAQPSDAFRHARDFANGWCCQNGAIQGDNGFVNIRAVGLAMPGVIEGDTATLRETANLRHWHGMEMQGELRSVFDVPFAILNDANAAAIAEARFGQHPSDALVLLTLGTGVGGGIVLNGMPWSGKHNCGGEIGHTTICWTSDARPCGCGRLGHLEAYAGASGISQTALDLISEDDAKESLLRAIETPTPYDIAVAAVKGDTVAIETIDRTAIHIGRAITGLAQVLDPAVVLLGGAIDFGGKESQMGRRFLDTVIQEVSRRSLREIATHLKVDFATLANDAGIIGAAYYAQQRLNR